MINKKGFSTVCIHGGFTPDEQLAHITPIYASSTYLFKDLQHCQNLFNGEEQGNIYGRFGNPTTTQTEAKIVALETYGLNMDAKAILHASGMAALTTLFLSTLKSGDAILTHFSLYGGTQELMDKILALHGITIFHCDFKNLNETKDLLKKHANIQLVYIETPANPTIQCVNIASITALAKQYNKKVACDNTFATPYLQQPFKFGVDFIMHSTTKFLNGHGSAIGGVLIGTDLEFMNTTATKHFRLLGGNSNGFDAYLLNMGIKTLEVRMERHCNNAMAVANYLHQHNKVAHVNYLGLPAHEDFNLANKQMRHPGAMLSFELKDGMKGGKTFLESIKIITHAVSLGTCDTLVTHPASTTHFGVNRDHRIKSGITDGLIRMSVGMENIDDILNDLEGSIF
jgi:methionine-gamma-lyase